MDISNLIAIFALIVSGVGIYLSYKNHRTTREWEFYKENIRQKEQVEQNYYSKNNSRVSIIPYFHLLLNNKIYVKNINDETNLILPISLINLGYFPSIYFRKIIDNTSYTVYIQINKSHRPLS